MFFSIKFWTTFYYFIFFAVIRRVIIMCVDTKSFKSFLNIIIYVNDRALLIKRYDVGSKKNEKWQRLMSKYVLWWGLQNWHWKNTIHTRESDSKINLSYRSGVGTLALFIKFKKILLWVFFFCGAYTFSKFIVPGIAARKE